MLIRIKKKNKFIRKEQTTRAHDFESSVRFQKRKMWIMEITGRFLKVENDEGLIESGLSHSLDVTLVGKEED